VILQAGTPAPTGNNWTIHGDNSSSSIQNLMFSLLGHKGMDIFLFLQSESRNVQKAAIYLTT
jgi:hypothetical protein